MTESEKLCSILNAFDELEIFSESHGLPITAAEIRRIKSISSWEIYSQIPIEGASVLLIDDPRTRPVESTLKIQ